MVISNDEITVSNDEFGVIVAGEADAGQRVDKTISSYVSELSRTRISTLMRQGHITRSGGRIVAPSDRVKLGDKFFILMPELESATPCGQDIALTILHEDDDVIVIDKPAGLVVHPGAGNPDGTLVNALIAHCGDTLSGIGGVKRPGIVHRLDKDTSGVMVVAKNDRAHIALSHQFADHGRTGNLRRCYSALVWATMPRAKGIIDQSIGRHPSDRTRQVIVKPGQGRFAITHYELVESFAVAGEEPLASLVKCYLETGRTHQVRVHLAFSGAPVIGDKTYGAGFRTKAGKLSAGAKTALDLLGRQALHASELTFVHPVHADTMTFLSPLPTDFANMAVQLSQL